MSHTSFRVNLYSFLCLNVKELLARSRYNIWSLSVSNGIRTHNHLVRKRTLNHLAKKASFLQTKWLWVQIPLLSPQRSILKKINVTIKLICILIQFSEMCRVGRVNMSLLILEILFRRVSFFSQSLESREKRIIRIMNCIWDKVFKSGLSKFCGRQPSIFLRLSSTKFT